MASNSEKQDLHDSKDLIEPKIEEKVENVMKIVRSPTLFSIASLAVSEDTTTPVPLKSSLPQTPKKMTFSSFRLPNIVKLINKKVIETTIESQTPSTKMYSKR
ncbi:hypothetical protein HMI54_014875 [Coelomomyces lativittatus]|nr:hypothetical protein HMI54_014875 [Coelomomyces lativittatus]